MLYEFLTLRHNELIDRCHRRALRRSMADEIDPLASNGVPLFLRQLVDTLRIERATVKRGTSELSPSQIGRAAALHGAERLRQGFSIDQVVHEYGDICQSVTELAIEEGTPISVDEFRTLNRCLDDAIADAVAAYGAAQQNRGDGEAERLRDSLEAYSEDCRRLIEIATHAFSAIRTGNVGLTGATASLLVHALAALGELAERELPKGRTVLNPPPAEAGG